mgnify:CR=1 FL=1
MWKLKTLLATLLLFQSLLLVAQSSRFEDDPALHKAIRSNNISEVKKLINSGTDVNTENDWRISAVEVAIQSNHIEIVKYLLSQGASDKSGMSSAAAHNNLEMVKLDRIMMASRNLFFQNDDLVRTLLYLVLFVCCYYLVSTVEIRALNHKIQDHEIINFFQFFLNFLTILKVL